MSAWQVLFIGHFINMTDLCVDVFRDTVSIFSLIVVYRNSILAFSALNILTNGACVKYSIIYISVSVYAFV